MRDGRRASTVEGRDPGGVVAPIWHNLAVSRLSLLLGSCGHFARDAVPPGPGTWVAEARGMRSFHPLFAPSFLVFAALAGWTFGTSGCSSSSSNDQPDASSSDDAGTDSGTHPGDDASDAGPDKDALPDATPDGGPDATPDTGADAGPSVWNTDATGFRIDASGGLPTDAPDGSPCTGDVRSWVYVVASRRLSKTGCSAGTVLDASVVLTADAAAKVIDAVSGLHAKGPTAGNCGADAPSQTLTIFGADGGVAGSYASDFYSGCPDAGSGPFVSDADLEGVLTVLLDDDLATCRADGGAADAGFVCGTADGGP
jgi:hypothetical protein